MPGAMPFGLKIAVINREFRKKMDEKAAAMGLTSVQLRVLGTISRLEAAGKEEIHQKDLEKIERVTHPAMTRLLQRLESKGFVRCVPSKQDRRFKAITCTDRFYTNMKWGYAQNYDLTLNSGTLGIDRCAENIKSLY